MARKISIAKQGTPESITVRLDPKIRFGLELLARKQRRNLSSVVEWAVQKVINDPIDGLFDEQSPKNNYLTFLWDVEPSDRLYLLATWRPTLLNFEEEKFVKTIIESDYFTYLNELYKPLKGDKGEPTPEYHQKMRESVREHFDTFKKVSEGQLGKDMLPKPPRGWSKAKPSKKLESNGDAA